MHSIDDNDIFYRNYYIFGTKYKLNTLKSGPHFFLASGSPFVRPPLLLASAKSL